MSDLGPLSDLSGKAGEEASKAASENFQEATTEAVKSRKRTKTAPKAEEAPAEPQQPKAEPAKVYLSAAVYKNPYSRKSFTVHLIQQKLYELGYVEAYSDQDGYYGDLTKLSIAEFQRDKQIDDSGDMTGETLNALFKDDERVEIVAE